jgi:hypothetical protein
MREEAINWIFLCVLEIDQVIQIEQDTHTAVGNTQKMTDN